MFCHIIGCKIYHFLLSSLTAVLLFTLSSRTAVLLFTLSSRTAARLEISFLGAFSQLKDFSHSFEVSDKRETPNDI
jgi:hypothetical protein